MTASTPAPTPRPRPTNAMVASAARIKIKQGTAKLTARLTQARQQEAWAAYDAVGEVHFGVNYLADHLAKLVLYPAMVPDDPRGTPTPDDDELSHRALSALRGPSGGYAEILREYAINLQIAGECYLVGLASSPEDAIVADEDRIAPTSGNLPASEVQQWDIKSADEIETAPDGSVWLRAFPGGANKIQLTDANSFIVRIWRRHPRYSLLADAPLFGVLASCEEITRIERAIRAAAKSRAAGPGLLLLPEEMSFGSVDPTRAAGSSEDPEGDAFQAELIEAMTTAIQDEGSASAVVPILVRGPSEMLKEIRKVSLAIDVDEKLLTLERAITRLAQGLNLPPEIITGKADLNHWVAWQVSEEVFSAHVEPLAVPIVDSLTTEWYRVYLQALGMSEDEANRRMLWYDATAIISRPNRSADADFGLEHIALSEKAWRKAKDFPEEDAPSDIERLMRLVMQRGSFDPVFTSVLLRALGLTDESTTIEIRQPPSPGPTPASPASPSGPPALERPSSSPPRRRAASLAIVASGGPDPSEVGLRLLDIDRDIATRLHSAADAALSRALDRAASIVVSKFRNDKQYAAVIEGMHDRRREVPARIGAITLQANGLTIESLLEDAFLPLLELFRSWSARAYDRAIRVLGLTSSSAPASELTDQQIDEAATWLGGALTLLASQRLFDPSPEADLFGELDDSALVPFALIREAIARAGGSTPSGIYGSPSLEPMGGIATGNTLKHSLLRVGGQIDGWQWVYGEAVRTREFPPHRDLDGARFGSWSDEVLSNRQTWPYVTHYIPGDHAGCLCMAAPIVNLPSEAVA